MHVRVSMWDVPSVKWTEDVERLGPISLMIMKCMIGSRHFNLRDDWVSQVCLLGSNFLLNEQQAAMKHQHQLNSYFESVFFWPQQVFFNCISLLCTCDMCNDNKVEFYSILFYFLEHISGKNKQNKRTWFGQPFERIWGPNRMISYCYFWAIQELFTERQAVKLARLLGSVGVISMYSWQSSA